MKKIISPFEKSVRLVKHLKPEERVALMKYISASLNGPRLYTSEEVQQYMHAAVAEYAEGAKSAVITPNMVRRQ